MEKKISFLIYICSLETYIPSEYLRNTNTSIHTNLIIFSLDNFGKEGNKNHYYLMIINRCVLLKHHLYFKALLIISMLLYRNLTFYIIPTLHYRIMLVVL